MKILILLLLLILAPIIAGIYGVLHDQITYTISHEYYTKFKFQQFGLVEEGYGVDIDQPRVLVSIVGFSATWWMGILIGTILGLVGLIHRTAYQMFKATLTSFLVAIGTAFITGLIGLLYGSILLS